MSRALVFLIGMVAGLVAIPVLWWVLATLHDRVYMPLFWIPRHNKRCAELEKKLEKRP